MVHCVQRGAKQCSDFATLNTAQCPGSKIIELLLRAMVFSFRAINLCGIVLRVIRRSRPHEQPSEFIISSVHKRQCSHLLIRRSNHLVRQ